MQIRLKGLQIYAYHGVLPQERETGSYFYINICLTTDFTEAAITDNLEKTISYADVFEAIKDEMNIPSLLLENVCERIGNRLFNDFPTINEIDIELTKENPPMGAFAQSIGVSAHYFK